MMKNLLLLLCYFLMPFHLSSQTKPKAIKYFQKAQNELKKNKTDQAITFLLTALKIDSTYKEAHLALYSIYASATMVDQALYHITAAAKLAGNDQASLWYNGGKWAAQYGKYNIAAEYLKTYLGLKTKDSLSRANALHLMTNVNYALSHMQNKVEYEPKLLNNIINTSAPEYLPSIDASGHTLVFTRRVQGQEDLFIAKGSDTNWVTSMPWSQNTSGNEGAHVISADGKTMVYTLCNGKEGYGNCDLYISELIASKWTQPKNMGAPINTADWESQPTLSTNGKSIYFVSNRPGGLGGYDIWQSNKKGEKWTMPVNAGKCINTPWDELSPWLQSDGMHIYFRSNGWPGYGSFDLFVAKKNEMNTWNVPLNLGYPINDFKDQGAMSVSIDGISAYLTQQELDPSNALLSSDIVYFKLQRDIASLPCVFIQGKVKSQAGKPIQNAKIVFNASAEPKRRDSISTDRDGDYLIILPRQHVYQFFCDADGYQFYSDRIIIDSFARDRVNYDIKLSAWTILDSIEIVKPIVLKNVLFEFGSAILTADSFTELDRIVAYLQLHKETTVDIRGHTDNVGISVINLKLSTQRAKAVHDYLLDKKVDPARMSYHGYGDSIPLVSNDSEENKAINRRVEIKFSKL